MDTAPNSPFDKLVQDVAAIKKAQVDINSRLGMLDSTILKLLKLFKTSEEAFDVRVARVLSSTLKGITFELDHSIEHILEGMAQLERGFDILPVDGDKVKENDCTILVTKTADGKYNYALARVPETIDNEGCEPYSAYFDTNPTLFGDRDELRVNIIVYTTTPTVET